MKTIYDFYKGDEIVRIMPAKEFSIGGIRDRSYMGEKLIFVGIANGQIYCKRTDSLSLKVFGDKLLNLSLDIWYEGWDLFIDPYKLFDGLESKIDTSVIEEQLKLAIKAENYELAEILKSKLK